MAPPHINCPACRHEIRHSKSATAPTACPACGKDIPKESSSTSSLKALDGAILKKFKDVDEKLYERLTNIVPEASWHLAVIAEILDYEYCRLSDTLNKSQTVNSRMFNLKSNKARVDLIKQQFKEYSESVIEIQEALTRYIDSGCKFPETVEFWDFYESISKAFDRLGQFHRTVIGLKFVRDSAENEIQSMMIDWVHYVIICLEALKKQLDRKSKLEPPQVSVRTVEVTLASPNLHLMFDRLEQLGDFDKSGETDST